jgi:hypothetical protein
MTCAKSFWKHVWAISMEWWIYVSKLTIHFLLKYLYFNWLIENLGYEIIIHSLQIPITAQQCHRWSVFALYAIFPVLPEIRGCVKSDDYGSESTQPMICRASSRCCCLVGYQRFRGIWGLNEVSCRPKETGG